MFSEEGKGSPYYAAGGEEGVFKKNLSGIAVYYHSVCGACKKHNPISCFHHKTVSGLFFHFTSILPPIAVLYL